MRSASNPPLARLKFPLLALGMAGLLGGCISHEVKFQDVNYAIKPNVAANASPSSVVAVISDATLAKEVPIGSWMVGIANRWNVEPGQMMKDVVLIEFPQQFPDFRLESDYVEPKGARALTVVLTIPSYEFADFHASVTVHAAAFGVGRRTLLDKDYTAQGFKQGAKMFFGGAFAMKSALRQSSLDAYKKIFVDLRPDLQKALDALP